VLREARLLEALQPEGVRVPRVLATCEDDEVIGAPFYVMEYVEGHVIGDDEPSVFGTVDSRMRISKELVDALVELHAVNPATPALATFRRSGGYLERQIRRFAATWSTVATREVPEIELVSRWLAENRPTSEETTVVHGDYRLGNVMYEPEHPRLCAVLDWEMAALGDPLADLGYLCATWAELDDTENAINRLSRVTRSEGFASRAAICERYAASSGRDVDDLGFYEVLALWKAAVFFEASYRRYRDGSTDDSYFVALAEGVPRLARQAWERTR
jgi:aminoglycoside phosphotransferase (APT) family kinase protein